jgi:formylglycine-generating enzyme required for sulfatase activity
MIRPAGRPCIGTWRGSTAAPSAWGQIRHYAEEAPIHEVTVDPFSIDCTPVTNREFREFVRATGHVTFAESRPILRTIQGLSRTC